MKRGLEQGLEQGLKKGVEKGLQKAIKGMYLYEKDTKKISSILDVDEKFVIKTLKGIKNEM